MRIEKAFLLFIAVILTASSLVLVKPSLAQVGVTSPEIPGFTVTLQTYLNHIPPTYSVDPSTGKAVMTEAGYTELESWVNVNIGGQPFVRYNNSAGQAISLYYNVRWESNNDSSWQSFNYSDGMQYYQDTYGDEAWGTQSTGVLIPIGFEGIDNGAVALQLLDPTASQISFQVEALIGYYNTDNVFVGQASGWSNTQTLTIPASLIATTSPSPTTTATTTPNLTPTTEQPITQNGNSTLNQTDLLTVIAALLAVIFALTVAVAVFWRRTKNPKAKAGT
jgi:hypothetical protein